MLSEDLCTQIRELQSEFMNSKVSPQNWQKMQKLKQ